MFGDFSLAGLLQGLYIIPGVFIGFAFHEFAHAAAAYMMGDDTAKRHGRLTIDPMVHLDIIGFLCLIFLHFGWAKPVPINPSNFRNRKMGTIITSLAGPLMNFALAFIAILTLGIMQFVFNSNNEIAINIISGIFIINIGLGVFNLIPLPPLDGSKILAGLLPVKYEYKFYQYERYGDFLLLALIITGMIQKIVGPAILFFSMSYQRFVGYIFGLFL